MNIIEEWSKGFMHSLIGGLLCLAYFGDFIFLYRIINTTGGEAVESFLYFIGCLFITICGPWAFYKVEESDC